MQCEGVGKPVHILTLFKRDANVDKLTSCFELNNYLFLVITSLSENIEILRRSLDWGNPFWQVIPVTLRNGWQKEEKDAEKTLVCDMFCRVIDFFFFNLCQGCWRLVESFFKQNYSHAFQTKFAIFFPLPSCCVFSLKTNHVDSRKQQNAGSGTSRLGN